MQQENMSGECNQFPIVDDDGKIDGERPPDDHENSKTDIDLDAAIEEAAKRRNLSTLNVKSIIHVRHVYNLHFVQILNHRLICKFKNQIDTKVLELHTSYLIVPAS